MDLLTLYIVNFEAMKKIISKFLVAFALLFGVLISCNKDEINPASEFIEEFSELSVIENALIIDPPAVQGNPTISTQGDFKCTTTEYEWSLNSPESLLLNPTSDVIYISALLDGTTPKDGSYRPIITRLSPKTISVNLSNIGGNPSIQVKNPSLSTVRTAVNELLRNLNVTSTPAQIFKSIKTVRSREETEISIKSHLEGFGVNVSGNFDWENTEIQSRHVVSFQQVYLTLDLDLIHRNAAEYFENGQMPNIDLFEGYVPVYVSSIKYGRQILFSIESEMQESAQKALLEATFNRFTVEGGIKLSSEERKLFESLSITAFVMGGDSEDAVKGISGVNELEDFLISGATYSAGSPGVPLAYTMRFLHDNSVAQVNLASRYTVRECELVTNTIIIDDHVNQTIRRCFAESINGKDLGSNPSVEGKVEVVRKGREIIAKLDIKLIENGGNQTIGQISANAREIVLGRLPANVNFEEFITDPIATFSYEDSDQEIDCYGTNSNVCGRIKINVSGELIKEIQMKANTSGDDVGPGECQGEGDAFIRLKLNPIKVKVKI